MTRKDICAKFGLKSNSSITNLIKRRTSEAEAQIAAQQALPDGPSSGGRIPVSTHNHSPSLSEMRTEGTAINLRMLQDRAAFLEKVFRMVKSISALENNLPRFRTYSLKTLPRTTVGCWRAGTPTKRSGVTNRDFTAAGGSFEDLLGLLSLRLKKVKDAIPKAAEPLRRIKPETIILEN